MNQKNIELFAFLYFCNPEDRDLLLGKREFTYAEFCRIYYIVSFFGLDSLACDLWTTYSEPFLQRIRQAEAFLSPCQEEMQEQQDALILSEIEYHESWIVNFCKSNKGWKRKILLQEAFKICEAKGLEFPQLCEFTPK